MAYEPTTWATGDIITAKKLNNIETGVSDAEDEAARIAARPVVTSVQINSTDGDTYTFYVTGENLPTNWASGALPAGTAALGSTDISAACHQNGTGGVSLLIDLSAIDGYTGKLDTDTIGAGTALVFTVGGVASAPYGMPAIPLVEQPAASTGSGT